MPDSNLTIMQMVRLDSGIAYAAQLQRRTGDALLAGTFRLGKRLPR